MRGQPGAGTAPPSTLLAVRNGPCARADALTNTPRRACSSGGAGHGQTGGGRSGVTGGSGPCGSRDFEGPSAPHRFSVRPTLEPTFTWLLTHGLCRRGRWPEAGGTCQVGRGPQGACRAGRGPQGLTACRQRCPQCTPGSVPASRRVPTAPLPSAGAWGSSSGHLGSASRGSSRGGLRPRGAISAGHVGCAPGVRCSSCGSVRRLPRSAPAPGCPAFSVGVAETGAAHPRHGALPGGEGPLGLGAQGRGWGAWPHPGSWGAARRCPQRNSHCIAFASCKMESAIAFRQYSNLHFLAY